MGYKISNSEIIMTSLEKNDIENIHVGIGLADSELISYCYNGEKNNLTIQIRAWNAKILEFIFFDLLLFCDKGGNLTSSFCLNKSANELFTKILNKTYDNKIPENHPYKFFQFLDIDDEPYLEIICENFEVKILDSSSRDIQPNETHNPRHHGQHYHVETRKDPSKGWGKKSNTTKMKPKNSDESNGTGFLPGEYFPGIG